MILCFVFAALVVILDQFFKQWIVRTIELGGTGPELIPGVLGLTRWENDGAMLNILSGQQWILAIIALLASVILIMILLRYNEGFLGTLGLTAVLGGTFGNLVDRVFNDGKVIDMFRTLFINFPIFNIADIFITLGFITFLIHFIYLTFKTDDSKELSPESVKASSRRTKPSDDDDPDYIDDAAPIDIDGIRELYADRIEADAPAAAVANSNASSADPGISEEEPAEAEYLYQESYAEAVNDSAVLDTSSAGYTEYDATTDTTPEISFTMEALDLDLGSLDVDYDVDELLREYGIEDD